MGKHVRQPNRGDCLGPTAMALLKDPLAFIHEDHLRARQICASIDSIAVGHAVPDETIRSVLHFLTTELPLHLMDEEEDLFPLLKRRCKPEDEIGKAIKKLLADHHDSNDQLLIVIDLLAQVSHEPRALVKGERDTLQAFVCHSRHHLILENAIILPFARLRLTELDLETLRIRMRQRRGLNQLRKTTT